MISPARTAAFHVLMQITRERSFSSVLLPAYEESLSEKDAALCHQLVLGVLRNQIMLDRLIVDASNKKKLDLEVRIALRLGVYQLRFLDRVPDYAAIGESVELVKRSNKRSAASFTNAVLRRLQKDGIKTPEFANRLEQVEFETSHPRWLISRWSRQFGEDEAEKIARANNEPPELSFRFTARFDRLSEDRRRKIKSDITSAGVSTCPLLDECMSAPKMNQMLRELEAEGLIYFQDLGSQLVASLASLTPGQRLIDVCAAPGGKTGALFRTNPSLLVCGDKSEPRLKTMRRLLKRQGAARVAITVYDAAVALPFPDGSFDCVLVDAPCSGTGTIRSNPELRYFVEEEDFTRHSAVQLSILTEASKLVVKGGVLIYATCSLESVENENVLERFLEDSGIFELTDIDLPDSVRTEEGYMRTIPSQGNFGGFFAARFSRV